MAHSARVRRSRLAAGLPRLLALDAAAGLEPCLERASVLLAEALGADNVDAYLYDAAAACLVKIGAPHSPLGERRRALGYDRLTTTHPGMTAGVFRTGGSRLSRHLDREPDLRRDKVAALGVLSAIVCRVDADGAPRGVLHALSARRARFGVEDLRVMQAAARWMGLILTSVGRGGTLAPDVIREQRGRAAEPPARLTPRERAVAALVAEGLSNQEIAERLVLVPGAAANHVEHILGTFGFMRRVQLAVWAAQQGLWSPPAPPMGGERGEADEAGETGHAQS
jgi:DNA-binding CsgD family transcriptional regulator